MADQFCLRFDDAPGASIPVRKEAAEFVDDFVCIQADGLGVIADERAREDAGGPLRKVVAFQAEPEIRTHFGDGHNRFDADAAPFAFTPKAGTEGVSIRHEDPRQGAKIEPSNMPKDRWRSSRMHMCATPLL